MKMIDGSTSNPNLEVTHSSTTLMNVPSKPDRKYTQHSQDLFARSAILSAE